MTKVSFVMENTKYYENDKVLKCPLFTYRIIAIAEK